MNIEEYKLHLKEMLIDSCQTPISHLFNRVRQNIDLYDTLIILQANLRIIERSKIEGTGSVSDLTLELNKIRKSVLEIINSLMDEDLISPHWYLEPNKVKRENTYRIKQNEVFCDEIGWKSLVKIGAWKFDKEKFQITGQGAYNYLLSEKEYGIKDFTITAEIIFNEISKHRFNAGFILGWIDKNEISNRRYYNILIEDDLIGFEGIGLFGGDDFMDFTHFTQGRAFKIEYGKKYSFAINVFKNEISIFVDSACVLFIDKPEDLVGKIGIRPWRSEMTLISFNSNEI